MSLSGKTPTLYTYGYAADGTSDVWNDQLTSYNGKAITYDAIGNPLTYGSYTYTWKFGRQLSAVSNSATNLSATYQYDADGIRTVKIVNGIRHEYDVMGGQINREVVYSTASATSAAP